MKRITVVAVVVLVISCAALGQEKSELSFGVGLTTHGHADYKLTLVPFLVPGEMRTQVEFTGRHTQGLWGFVGGISIPLAHNLRIVPGMETGTLHEEYFVGLTTAVRYEPLHGLFLEASGARLWVPTKHGEWEGSVAVGYSMKF